MCALQIAENAKKKVVHEEVVGTGESSMEGLHVYYCGGCSALALILLCDIATRPRRKTDESYVVNERKYVKAVKMRQGACKRIRRCVHAMVGLGGPVCVASPTPFARLCRAKGIEKQYRYYCSGTLVSPRAPTPARRARSVTVRADSVRLAAGVSACPLGHAHQVRLSKSGWYVCMHPLTRVGAAGTCMCCQW